MISLILDWTLDFLFKVPILFYSYSFIYFLKKHYFFLRTLDFLKNSIKNDTETIGKI